MLDLLRLHFGREEVSRLVLRQSSAFITEADEGIITLESGGSDGSNFDVDGGGLASILNSGIIHSGVRGRSFCSHHRGGKGWLSPCWDHYLRTWGRHVDSFFFNWLHLPLRFWVMTNCYFLHAIPWWYNILRLMRVIFCTHIVGHDSVWSFF